MTIKTKSHKPVEMFSKTTRSRAKHFCFVRLLFDLRVWIHILMYQLLTCIF